MRAHAPEPDALSAVPSPPPPPPRQALLTTGLSTEYTRKAPEQTSVAGKSVGQEEPVQDTNIAAKYYINQILAMDEASIQRAWTKVRHGAGRAVHCRLCGMAGCSQGVLAGGSRGPWALWARALWAPGR